jgi:hypothetical protein
LPVSVSHFRTQAHTHTHTHTHTHSTRCNVIAFALLSLLSPSHPRLLLLLLLLLQLQIGRGVHRRCRRCAGQAHTPTARGQSGCHLRCDGGGASCGRHPETRNARGTLCSCPRAHVWYVRTFTSACVDLTCSRTTPARGVRKTNICDELELNAITPSTLPCGCMCANESACLFMWVDACVRAHTRLEEYHTLTSRTLIHIIAAGGVWVRVRWCFTPHAFGRECWCCDSQCR